MNLKAGVAVQSSQKMGGWVCEAEASVQGCSEKNDCLYRLPTVVLKTVVLSYGRETLYIGWLGLPCQLHLKSLNPCFRSEKLFLYSVYLFFGKKF